MHTGSQKNSRRFIIYCFYYFLPRASDRLSVKFDHKTSQYIQYDPLEHSWMARVVYCFRNFFPRADNYAVKLRAPQDASWKRRILMVTLIASEGLAEFESLAPVVAGFSKFTTREIIARVVIAALAGLGAFTAIKALIPSRTDHTQERGRRSGIPIPSLT